MLIFLWHFQKLAGMCRFHYSCFSFGNSWIRSSSLKDGLCEYRSVFSKCIKLYNQGIPFDSVQTLQDLLLQAPCLINSLIFLSGIRKCPLWYILKQFDFVWKLWQIKIVLNFLFLEIENSHVLPGYIVYLVFSAEVSSSCGLLSCQPRVL